MSALGNHVLSIGGGQFDPVGGTLSLDGRLTKLRPRTAAVLAHLVRSPHQVVSKDELLRAVWPDVIVTEDSLVQCIKEIRRALGDEGRDWIRTIPRQGYAFVAPAGNDLEAATARVHRGVTRRGLYAALGLAMTALVALASMQLLRWNGASSSSAPTLSLIVRPLANLTNDASKEDFIDEMTERLTVALGQLPGATVIASGTAFTLKGKSIDARRIGAELAVRYVLEGSVRQQMSRMVLSLSLVDATNAVNLWSEDFSADKSQLSTLRDDVLARVAGTLNLRLIRAEAQRSHRDRPENPDAADLLIRARASLRWAGQGQEGVLKAQQLLQEAVRREPAMAEGWALLAMTYLNEIRFSNSRDESLRRAVDSLDHALALSPDDALVQEAKAKVFYNEGRMAQALAAFDRAIELSPNDPVLHANRGAALSMLGRPQEGLSAIEKAIHLSPRDPQLPTWLMLQGATCLHLARDSEAIELLQRSVDGNPKSAFARLFLASALGLAGRIEEARVQAGELQRLAPGFTITRMRAREPSDTPDFRAQRERVYDGLRQAGLPE